MLLDVHRDADPCVRIAWIGTKSHRVRRAVVEGFGHDAHCGTGANGCPGDVFQRGILSSDDEDPPVEVDPVEVSRAHVHSLQFRR